MLLAVSSDVKRYLIRRDKIIHSSSVNVERGPAEAKSSTFSKLARADRGGGGGGGCHGVIDSLYVSASAVLSSTVIAGNILCSMSQGSLSIFPPTASVMLTQGALNVAP